MEIKEYSAFILIRLMSLYLFLQGIALMPMSITTVATTPTFYLMEPQFFILLFSIILWIVSKPLANFMIKGYSAEISHAGTVDSYSLEYVLISIVGLYIVVVAIPSLFSMIAYHQNMVSLKDDFSHKAEMISSFYSYLVRDTMKILLGLILIVFSKKIAHLFRHVRSRFDEKPI